MEGNDMMSNTITNDDKKSQNDKRNLSNLELFLKWRKTADVSYRNQLVKENMGMVAFIANKFESTGIDIDDLVSIGTYGLIKGINTFDPGRETKLITYASRCIENEILMYLRKTKKIRETSSLDTPIKSDLDGNNMHLTEILSNGYCIDDEAIREVMDPGRMEMIISIIDSVSLTSQEKAVLYLRYGLLGERILTQKEVAEKLDISQSYISRLEKRSLIKIRNSDRAEELRDYLE
jgi:RNA polymerase sporulation-specific sigma factor